MFPIPVITGLQNVQVCAGATVPINCFNCKIGCTYCWTISNTTIGIAANGTGCVPSYTAVNDTSVPVTSTITVTPTANGCLGPMSSYTITVFNCPDTITGKVFYDDNNDGLMNNAEQGAANIMVKISPENYYTYTDSAGRYATIATMATHTITIPNPPAWQSVTPYSQTATFSASGQTDSLNDFAFYCPAGITDLAVSLTGTNSVFGISGGFFPWQYHVHYSNNTNSIASGTIRLILDTEMSYTNSTPVCSSQSGDTLTWNFTNLLPYSSGNIWVSAGILLPPAGPPLGTPLMTSAMIFPVIGDTMPQNNADTLYQVVAYSYDPNDKSVTPSEPLTAAQFANETPLTYTIRFQNTGNAPAINIVVEDTISDHLNFETIEMIAASHEYALQVSGDRALTWTFSNINLPDSNTNEVLSHGYIKYRIRPLTAFSELDTIKNTAYIYFDMNDAVVTNTVSTYMQSITVSMNDEGNAPQLKIYPNPATDKICVEYGTIGSGVFELFDAQGSRKTTVSLPGTADVTKIDLGNLRPGFYLFTVRDENGRRVQSGKLMLTR